MSIFISESQRKILIFESVKDDIKSEQTKSSSLVERIINDIKSHLYFDFKFVLTWSTTIGGFIGPLSQLIDGEYPSLTNTEKSLILGGIIFQVLFQNDKNIIELLKVIKDKGLMPIYDKVLEKANNLKSSLLNFLSGLNITLKTTSSIIAYTFLIPIIPILYQLSTQGISDDQIVELAKRITSWGVTIVSTNTISNIFQKILEKFKNK
jgi:hypothetical protein